MLWEMDSGWNYLGACGLQTFLFGYVSLRKSGGLGFFLIIIFIFSYFESARKSDL